MSGGSGFLAFAVGKMDQADLTCVTDLAGRVCLADLTGLVDLVCLAGILGMGNVAALPSNKCGGTGVSSGSGDLGVWDVADLTDLAVSVCLAKLAGIPVGRPD